MTVLGAQITWKIFSFSSHITHLERRYKFRPSACKKARDNCGCGGDNCFNTNNKYVTSLPNTAVAQPSAYEIIL